MKNNPICKDFVQKDYTSKTDLQKLKSNNEKFDGI